MKLIDIVDRLSSFDEEMTIYAKEPWTPDSDAIVAREPHIGGIPPEAKDISASYVIEVFVANQFLGGMNDGPTAMERCVRLIRYVIDDA